MLSICGACYYSEIETFTKIYFWKFFDRFRIVIEDVSTTDRHQLHDDHKVRPGWAEEVPHRSRRSLPAPYQHPVGCQGNAKIEEVFSTQFPVHILPPCLGQWNLLIIMKIKQTWQCYQKIHIVNSQESVRSAHPFIDLTKTVKVRTANISVRTEEITILRVTRPVSTHCRFKENCSHLTKPRSAKKSPWDQSWKPLPHRTTGSSQM